MLLAGSAFLGYALHELSRSISRPQPIIVGGVDMTNTDPTQPFMVDFSVSANAKPAEKRGALERLRVAFEAFRQWQPTLVLHPDTDVRAGRMVLYAFPSRI